MTDGLYSNCRLCPRNCQTDRTKKTGYCGQTARLKAARAGLHMYEEPFISGKNGSGTVFFSGCSMKCVFCQNIKISRDNKGFEITKERLSEIFIEQQNRGAHNINIVTGTHFTPDIAEAIGLAKEKGLKIPVVWNSSGYEKRETLMLLEGLVDIWMPDFKTLSPELGKRYFNAADYPKYAMDALDYMVSVSKIEFEDDMMISGVIVRHLMMPGSLMDTKKVLKYLSSTYGGRIWISLMNQYTPMGNMPFEELNRAVSKREYDRAVDYAIKLGIEQCMIQEGETVSESFIPEFDGTGIVR
jgi:putative pyruvate formate lyase activating enzyme